MSKVKLRPVGQITTDLEKLYFELCVDHELQVHEVIGLFFLWAQVHCPGAFEKYTDGSSPELYYGPKK